MTTTLAPHPLTVYEFLQEAEVKPLPSPTLTNPDMVLPSEMVSATRAAPQADGVRPPSLSYLREQTSGYGSEQSQSRSATPKREKRGLMSRKMMLLRSRTGSGMNVNATQQPQPSSALQHEKRTTDVASEDYEGACASSPTLMDVGNLAPVTPEEPVDFDFEQLQPVQYPAEQPQGDEGASDSDSSVSSEVMAGIPSFLAKYEATDTATDDELFDSDSPAHRRVAHSVSIDGSLDAHRRQQEKDEYNSALLSKRAEQILANAKRRLNVRVYILPNTGGTY